MDVFSLSASLSFGLLGIVLLWRKFDFYYGCLCLCVGVMGYFWPYVILLPYFMVVWRVLIGKHVITENELFIGQHQGRQSESDVSGSLVHWIVAVKPADEERYYVTHAVGEVISGDGIRLPFKWKTKEEIERYDMYRVGWVTRRNREEHMRNVQENEPMASGYSCQEYAVDIAFQISSSRTYTFIKCVTLPRLRTVIYLLAVVCSVILYSLLHKQPEYSLIPEIFNFLSITHVFVATEAYRLGHTNVRRERDFWGGLKDRLKVYFGYISYMDMFKLIVLLLFCVGVQIWMNNTMLTVSFMVVAIIMAKG